MDDRDIGKKRESGAHKESVRVLVVDDSALIRKFLTEALNSTPCIRVVGTASDGVFALEKLKRLSPDVITLDFHMPRMDGLQTLKKIMSECPTPVIMFSSTTTEGAHLTVQALRLGAVDFMPKPSGSLVDNLRTLRTELVEKILAARNSNLFQLDTAQNRFPQIKQFVRRISRNAKRKSISQFQYHGFSQYPFFAIGCSTGGPQALEKIIPALPAGFRSPIGVVQHMPEPFLSVYAEHLDKISKLKVEVARENSLFRPGAVLLAPGDAHMRLKRFGNKLIAALQALESEGLGQFPSVDAFFCSVAKVMKKQVAGIVLSGMGKDGTAGLRAIKMVGGFTVAQNRESAVVYGMPGYAICEGVVDQVTNPREIAWVMANLAYDYEKRGSFHVSSGVKKRAMAM